MLNVKCAPLERHVKRVAIGSITTHQISEQSVQPFPRYGKEVGTCARAAVPTLDFRKTPS